LLACVRWSRINKPRTLRHPADTRTMAEVSMGDMWNLLVRNGPFQRYLISAASDKLAQVVKSQAVIGTLMFGILLGNMQLGTTLGAVAILPGIVFAIFGGRYRGTRGAKAATVTG